MTLTPQSLLPRLLDPNARTEPVPLFKFKKPIRKEEYVLPVISRAKILCNFSLSHASVNAAVVSHMQQLFDQNGMKSCMYAKQKLEEGELCHYFDHIWVISGAVQDERLICKRVKEAEFVPLRYCPGSCDKDANNDFLSFLEERWFACRVDLGSQQKVEDFLRNFEG